MFFPCEPKNQAALLNHKEELSLKVISFAVSVRKNESRSDLKESSILFKFGLIFDHEHGPRNFLKCQTFCLKDEKINQNASKLIWIDRKRVKGFAFMPQTSC